MSKIKEIRLFSSPCFRWKMEIKVLGLGHVKSSITEETIREVAETGVDYISVGALTHSIKSLDMSLKAEIIT